MLNPIASGEQVFSMVTHAADPFDSATDAAKPEGSQTLYHPTPRRELSPLVTWTRKPFKIIKVI
jgi:hypothetical protein